MKKFYSTHILLIIRCNQTNKKFFFLKMNRLQLRILASSYLPN
jgi:hypothetical protein